MNDLRPPCAVCNLDGHLKDERITETDDTRRVIVVVRNVPAQVCDRCGTTTVTDEVAEMLERHVAAQQGTAVSGSVLVDYGTRPIALTG